MMFDPNKTYTIHVWDMPICVVDDETEDYILNYTEEYHNKGEDDNDHYSYIIEE